MTNFESFNPEKKYSNRHESTKGKILEHTYKNSNEEGRRADVRSKNFDAYTKLAGEGARFRCVRNNIAKITDDTVFYAAGQMAVSLSILYGFHRGGIQRLFLSVEIA